ncbi:hypothetical protein [Xenorhabdus innexi]|uniref:Transposase n=1 Tax=Xenorhabdus innexi TaxID=290109 RepID=A0A1N6MWG0_9GAMM|nr:hypothetical protein [Xenorhabdus innexi]PHM35934.1 hypothetical protein Xinn_02004 [Xenorhabdus innexi]SIP73233.1 hypothetical protein XIS1_1790039 [Xenorhabdus innexi]
MITDEQYRGINRLRNHVIGRHIRWFLEAQLAQAREQYETHPATEERRRLLQAYKTVLRVLFITPMEKL